MTDPMVAADEHPGGRRADDVPMHEVVIVGAGFGGIGVAIKLNEIGVDDYVILEQAQDVGGTWRDNTYPGLEVDVPSFSYSYGFALSADWSHVYAPGPEVLGYIKDCADEYGLWRHIRFGCKVSKADFVEESATWNVTTAAGDTLRARYLVHACGYLSEPRLPDIEGIADYAGKIVHTARWDHEYDFRNKRVAIIGTGATAIQLAPNIAEQAGHLTIFQRTPIWLSPKFNPPLPDGLRRTMRRLPFTMRLIRASIWLLSEIVLRLTFVNHARYHVTTSWIEKWLIRKMREKVDDPDVQEQLIPRYSFFCKRPSFSNTFYPMFNRDNVELVTTGIERVTEKGVVTVDGTQHDVDALICATGFHVFDRSSAPMFHIAGEGGRSLGDWWADYRYQAYLGTTIPAFPNFFYIFGPFSVAGASYHDILNNQVVHIARVLSAARKRGSNYAAVRQDIHDRDTRLVRRKARNTVLVSGNCGDSNTYYFDRFGDSPSGPRPTSMSELWLKTRLFRLSNYRFESRAGKRANKAP